MLKFLLFSSLSCWPLPIERIRPIFVSSPVHCKWAADINVHCTYCSRQRLKFNSVSICCCLRLLRHCRRPRHGSINYALRLRRPPSGEPGSAESAEFGGSSSSLHKNSRPGILQIFFFFFLSSVSSPLPPKSSKLNACVWVTQKLRRMANRRVTRESCLAMMKNCLVFLREVNKNA